MGLNPPIDLGDIIENMHMRVEEAYNCHVDIRQEHDDTVDDSIMRGDTVDEEEDMDVSLEIQFSAESFQKVTALGLTV